MSNQQEIQRLQQAKSNLKTAIQNQGVSVPDSARLDEYSALVDSISTVRSVSGVSPDAAGDVDLTPADIGGLADVQIGIVTTGDPGTQASVTAQKENAVARLNFVIPKGDPGDVVQQTYIGEAEPTDPDVIVWIDTGGGADIPASGMQPLTFTGLVNKSYNGGSAVTVEIPKTLSSYTNDAGFQTAEDVTLAINEAVSTAIGNALEVAY